MDTVSYIRAIAMYSSAIGLGCSMSTFDTAMYISAIELGCSMSTFDTAMYISAIAWPVDQTLINVSKMYWK